MTSEAQKAAAMRWRAKNPDYYREYMRQWRAKNRERFLAYRDKYDTPERYRKANLKRNYGMSVETYEALLNAQGGVCAICGEPPGKKRLAVDHDHNTKRNRGLLCYVCNAALNKFEKYPDFGDKALAYLTKYIEQMVRS